MSLLDHCPVFRREGITAEEQRLGVSLAELLNQREEELHTPIQVAPTCVLFGWPRNATDVSQGRYLMTAQQEGRLLEVCWTEDRRQALRLTHPDDVELARRIARGDGWITELRPLAAWEI